MVLNEIAFNRNSATLLFDSESIRLPKHYLDDFPFKVHDDIDPDELDRWILEKQYKPALNYAVSLLASRPFSEKELESRLRLHGYRKNTVELILFKLNRYDLLNDADFAAQWAQARSSRNIGSRRIAMELHQKGVDNETIEQALENIDEDNELKNAMDLVRRQLSRPRREEDPRKTAQRLTAMLVRHGYSFEIARQAISQVKDELNIEEE